MITKDRHPTEPLTRKGPGQPDAGARTEALDGATCHEMVVIIRPSFKKLCEQDACRAALLNHLLYWIAQKAKGQDAARIKSGEVYWYGSAEDICAGLDQSWSIWKVRNELKALVGSGLIGQRHNPVKGWDREYQYFIGEEQGQVLGHEFRKCIYGIHQMHVLKTEDAFTENSRAIPKDSTEVTIKASPKGPTKTESSTAPTDEPLATTPTVPSPDATTSSEKRDQGQQAPPPTTRASQPFGKTPSSEVSAQPQGKPEVQSLDMPWGPEKMVRLTEYMRFCRGEQGAFFSTEPTGKSGKSQLFMNNKVADSEPSLYK